MDTQSATIFAQLIGVSPNQIKKATELKHVYSVVFTNENSNCCTFVSKAKAMALLPLEVHLQPVGRQRCAWVAKLVGLCPRWGFQRTFLVAKSRKFDSRGLIAATFEITEPGIYQDSDDDYYVIGANRRIERFLCRNEVKQLLEKVPAFI